MNHQDRQRQELSELRQQWQDLFARVEAIVQQPGATTDAEQKLTLTKRRRALEAERDALAPSEAGLPVEDLARQAGLSAHAVRDALGILQRHDVVAQTDSTWRFTVELMRRWVAQREG